MGRRHEKTGGIKLVTVKPERREITESLTEFFSVRTDIPPEVVCASFGDHCMELLPRGYNGSCASQRQKAGVRDDS